MEWNALFMLFTAARSINNTTVCIVSKIVQFYSISLQGYKSVILDRCGDKQYFIAD